MTLYPTSRFAGWSFNLIACAALAAATVARAQTPETALAASDHETVRLDNYIVSASRSPQDIQYTPSSVSALSISDLAQMQVADLRTALASEPGVIVVNTGASGSQSTILMRGSNADQTLFVVDGVRMNDRSTAYQNFLGQADLGGIDRLEILRGPQSTLYGSSAMGGVIAIDTTHGCGDPSGSLAAMAGSFHTMGGSASVQGGTKELGYSGFIERSITDNDRPFNDSRIWNYATRVEYKPLATALVGVTFRGQDGDYQEPGTVGNLYTGLVEAKNYLCTAYGQMQLGAGVTSKLTAAWHQRDYAYASYYGITYTGTSYLRNTRDILDWQNTWTASRELEVVGGANYERSYYTINGSLTSDTVKAAYVSATYHPVQSLVLTGGVRADDYNSVGSEATWRTGLAWIPEKGSKLHATYGTGFSAPGSDDRFGVGAFGQLPNPNLRPEKSRGWDVGFDQEIYGDSLVASVTYFHNRFTDLFQWQYVNYITYQGMTVNIGRATTQGVEFALDGKLNKFLTGRLAYTYLDATDDISGQRLIRRPRHVIDSEVRWQVAEPWLLGVGLHIVADREDTNFTTGQQIDSEDYTTVRVFASYEAMKNLFLKVRVENALNEKYSEVLGYPALPRAFYGSVEWKY